MNNPNWIAGDRFKLGGPDSSVEGVVEGFTVCNVEVQFDHNEGVNHFDEVWFDEHATKLPKPLKRGDRVRVIEGGWKDRKGIVLGEWDDTETSVSLDITPDTITIIQTDFLIMDPQEDSDGAH